MIVKKTFEAPKPPAVLSKRNITPLYRYRRTGAFVYVEGNENPVNLRTIKATGNPELNNQILNQRVDNLWYEHNPQKELIWKIAIIIGVVALIIMLALKFFVAKDTTIPVT